MKKEVETNYEFTYQEIFNGAWLKYYYFDKHVFLSKLHYRTRVKFDKDVFFTLRIDFGGNGRGSVKKVIEKTQELKSVIEQWCRDLFQDKTFQCSLKLEKDGFIIMGYLPDTIKWKASENLMKWHSDLLMRLGFPPEKAIMFSPKVWQQTYVNSSIRTYGMYLMDKFVKSGEYEGLKQAESEEK